MPLSIALFRRGAAVLLTVLLTSYVALAQTAPPWLGATSLDAGTNMLSVNADVDAAGNTYEAGNFQGTITLAGTTLTSVGGNDAFLAKYTSAGTLAWVRQVGSTGYDILTNVAVDAAGNAYVTGYFAGTIALGNGLTLTGNANGVGIIFCAVRYSAQGTPEWAQQSVPTTTANSGGGIAVDGSGTVWVVGDLTRSITIGTTNVSTSSTPGGFLARFAAATGAVQSLTKLYEYVPVVPPAVLTHGAPKMALGPAGTFYLGLNFYSPVVVGNSTLNNNGSTDVMIAKYNAQGSPEWAQSFGGTGTDQFTQAVSDAAGNLYVTASFAGPVTLGATTLPSTGSTDGALVKYSPQGALAWVQTLAGPGTDDLQSVTLDGTGRPYVVGSFSASAQLSSTTLTSAGSRDIAVAAYTPQGQLRWTQQAGGTGADLGGFIGLSTSGELLIRGSFNASCAFGPYTLTTTLARTAFLARLGSNPLAVRSSLPAPTAFYPNPATNAVHLPDLPAGTHVQVLDALGRVAFESTISAAATVSVLGLVPGLYTLRATDKQGWQYVAYVLVE